MASPELESETLIIMTSNITLQKFYSLYKTRHFNQFEKNGGLIHENDTLIKLNLKNGLIERKKYIFRIHVDINHDITEYDKFSTKDYYFASKWTFPDGIAGVYFVNILDTLIVTDEFQGTNDYQLFNKEYIDKFSFKPSNSELLNFVNNEKCNESKERVDDFFDGSIQNNNYLDHSSEFCFKSIEIQRINNSSHEINYHGAYFTDSLGMYFADSTFCSVALIQAKPDLPFYKELLLDCFNHLNDKNFKMAYFNAFAAFENFVNVTSCRATERLKLSKKFKFAYNNNQSIPNFELCRVYRQLRTALDSYTKIRNEIAHGNIHTIDWSSPTGEAKATEMFLYSTIAMMCFEHNFQTLDELKAFLEE